MNNLVTALHFELPVWHGIVLAVLLGLILYIIWSPFKRYYSHRCVQRLIRRLGHDSLNHVTIMDGSDLPLYIDHLILQADGLLLLNVKPFRGNIFAADKIDKWTQVIRHRSFKFSNPLHELETNLQALRGMLPKVKIVGRVVFAQDAVFPKGKPEAVCDFDDLKAMTGNGQTSNIPSLLRQAWTQVCAAVEQDENLHASGLYQKVDKRRLLFGIFLFIACLIYFLYAMGWLLGMG